MSVHETVSTDETIEPPVKRARRRLGVSWPTIILFAVVISYVSGFWVTSLQGAIGSLERSEPPFQRWLRDSTLMVPVYVGAILVAVLLARRWFGRSPRALVARRGAAGLIIAACTLVGIAEVANSSAYDYHLQTQHIDLVHDLNHADSAASTTPAASASDCVSGRARQKESTLGLHIRAVTVRQRADADHQRPVGGLAPRRRR